MKRIPMCWKCSRAILEEQPSPYADFEVGMVVLTGCKDCGIIKSYEDATVHCPLLSEEFDVQSSDGE